MILLLNQTSSCNKITDFFSQTSSIYPQCRAVQSTRNHPDTEYLQSPKAEEKKRQLGPEAMLVGIVVVQKKQSSTWGCAASSGERLLPSRRCTWFKPWQRNSNAAPLGNATEAQCSWMIHKERIRITENIESGLQIWYFPYNLNNSATASDASSLENLLITAG